MVQDCSKATHADGNPVKPDRSHLCAAVESQLSKEKLYLIKN
jgi:hypothetical protein